ncbi:MAG: DNA-directed RNA polymerase subunit omega [Actinomycetaceae bacterium]|nr:DNA-directed RNA polymerase subunit omega [Actinomycetaceae bacterium]
MSGTQAHPEGITNPPIDTLLDRVPSKYALVIYAAKRARQINTYYQQVADGMYSTPGPLLDTEPDEKPLSISLREINEGLLEFSEAEDEPEQPLGEAEEGEAPDFGDIEAALEHK